MLFGKLICKILGHKRGKPGSHIWKNGVNTHKEFICPRCGRVRKYKIKEKA